MLDKYSDGVGDDALGERGFAIKRPFAARVA